MNIVDWTASRFDSMRERLGEGRFYPLMLGALLLAGLLPLLMQENPSVLKAIGRTTELLREDDACLSREAEMFLKTWEKNGAIPDFVDPKDFPPSRSSS